MTVLNMNETIANVAELRGLLADARRQNLTFVIVKIPIRLMAIDTDYQTPIRTERDLSYLTKNWDERKICTLTGIPHDEEGLIYLTDGYGRLTASQIVDPEKYKELNVLVILDAPTEPAERKRFEAELFASQGNNRQVTPLQKHGARQVMGDPVVKAMDELQKQYGFIYKALRGQNGEGIIGSYSELYKNIRVYGEGFGKFFFDICAAAGFNRKTNGYAVYIMRSIRDLYKLYPENRADIKEFLSNKLRPLDYRWLHSKANSHYELLGPGNAMTMYFEDMVTIGLNLEHKREVYNNRIVEVAS